MQWLAEICVKRPIFATVLSILIIVIGLAFYAQLGVDQFPKIDLPVVTVTTRLPGSSAEDMETEVTDKIEAAVNTISSLDELRSTSSEGVSIVTATFLLEKNADVGAQEVRDRVNSVLSDLPKNIDQPVVTKLDPDAQPIFYLALQSTKNIKDTTEYADLVLRRRLENVSGVGEVTLLGGQKRQVNVYLDPVRMRALGITAVDVSRAIAAQNLTLPGGRIDASRDQLTLRVHGRVESVNAMSRIVVREGAVPIRLEDIANVEDGVADQETAAVWNGGPTVVLAVRKQSGTNTIEVVDALRQRVTDLQPTLPAGMKLEVLRDASETIRTGTDAVKEHLVLGALFAAIVVLLFLGNFRSTIIAAVAIPTSIIGTFGLMKLMGYTLNTITLLALALAVGIVIDDAIVVLENIFRHVEEKREPPKIAAINGTKEIGLAVLATTFSLVAVFLPVSFLAGIPGRFLSSFGITMAFSIIVSLFVSFTLTPMLASVWLKLKPEGEHKKGFVERVVDGFYGPIERGYGHLLAFCLRHRWVVVVASLLALASMAPMAKIAKKGFLPVDDKAQFEVSVRLPEGRSLIATKIDVERIARSIRGIDDVNATLVTIGDDPARTPNLGRIYVKLTDPSTRKLSQNEIKDEVRSQVLAKLPGDIRASVADVNEIGGGQSTARIQQILSGPDLDVLEKTTANVLAKLKKVPGAVDVDSNLISGKPELSVRIDRDRAADLGVQVQDVAQALQLLVGGQAVSNYAEAGEQYDVDVRADKEFRTDADQLQLLTVPSRKLGQVPLSDVVTLKESTGPATINRFQRQRQVTLLANAAPGFSEGAIGDAMLDAINAEHLPSTFQVSPTGQTKFMKQTAISFAVGLLLAMVFMYLILAAQFNSWLHPVTILLSLPLTLPFAILSINLFGLAIDIFSLLGIFVLFGVVKKNAILQIDHTNQLRAHGMDRLPAMLQANKDRLRPILMTTFAFVAGMIPLLVSNGIGAGFNRATAGVVVGGQVFSLLLTLVAVPVVYSFFDDMSSLFTRVVARVRRHDGPSTSASPGRPAE